MNNIKELMGELNVINQEIIRPEGRWYCRQVNGWFWLEIAGRPAYAEIYFKRGRFFIYKDELAGIEYAYRY